MIRYFTLLLFVGLVFWSCEEEQNTTPPVDKWWEDYLDYQYLDLGGSNLTGEFPPEIGNLTNLIELALYNNQLTGSIPSEIGTFTSMTMLKLQDNQLNGDIPESICELNITWSDSNRFRTLQQPILSTISELS